MMDQAEIEDLAQKLAYEHMRNFEFLGIVENFDISEEDADRVFDLIINAGVII